MSATRHAGSVKWFDCKRGFGFITSQGVDRDIFVHFSGIAMDGFKKLRHGDLVEFELVDSGKGLLAHNVSPVQTAAGSEPAGVELGVRTEQPSPAPDSAMTSEG
jgi:CspA family cold shock protein